MLGVPDEKDKEVCAVVVPLPPVDADELVTRSLAQPGGDMYPHRVEIVEALPMGPSRKALRRELRTRFA